MRNVASRVFGPAWVFIAMGCGATVAPHASEHAAGTAVEPPARSAQLDVVVASEGPCTARLRQDLVFAAQSGPIRIDADSPMDRVRTRLLSVGDAAMGGQGETTYVVEVAHPSSDVWHEIFRSGIQGEGEAGLVVVDLDRDGRAEIFVREVNSWMDCDMQGGGQGTKWLIIAGDGRVLFRGDGHTRTYDFELGQHIDSGEHAFVARLPSGADAIGLLGRGHLRVVASGASREEAAATVRCDTVPAART